MKQEKSATEDAQKFVPGNAGALTDGRGTFRTHQILAMG